MVELQATFTDKNGALLDPGAVLITMQRPNATETTATYLIDETVEKVSTGVYRYAVSIDQPGTWYYRWKSTGTGAAAVAEFKVRRTPFAT